MIEYYEEFILSEMIKYPMITFLKKIISILCLKYLYVFMTKVIDHCVKSR